MGRAGRWRVLLVVAVAASAVACGGGGDDDDTAADDDPSATTTGGEADEEAVDLPAGCPTEEPFTVGVEGGDALPGIDGPSFEVAQARVRPFPIVPDPERELTPEEATEQGEKTDLLGYSLYLADFRFDEADIGLFGMTPDDDGTLLVLSVVPPTLDGIAAGDTVVAGERDYETITTLATISTLYDTAVVEEHPFLSTTSEEPGRAEILHLDGEWLCMRWVETGQVNAAGGGAQSDYAIDEVVAGRLLPRASQPFN